MSNLKISRGEPPEAVSSLERKKSRAPGLYMDSAASTQTEPLGGSYTRDWHKGYMEIYLLTETWLNEAHRRLFNHSPSKNKKVETKR